MDREKITNGLNECLESVLAYCANEGIYCSECNMKIFDRTTKPKKKLSQYCPHCGSRNDQFFRDEEVVFR